LADRSSATLETESHLGNLATRAVLKITFVDADSEH
jgi:hypothetical protein